MKIPTIWDFIYVIVTFVIFKALPIILIVTYLLKIIIRTVSKRLSHRHHLIDIIISVIPSAILLVIFLIIVNSISYIIPGLILFLSVSIILFLSHELIDYILTLKKQTAYLVVALIVVLAIISYPKESKEERVDNNAQVVIKTCQCIGIKTGGEYDPKHFCYGIVNKYSCKETIRRSGIFLE